MSHDSLIALVFALSGVVFGSSVVWMFYRGARQARSDRIYKLRRTLAHRDMSAGQRSDRRQPSVPRLERRSILERIAGIDPSEAEAKAIVRDYIEESERSKSQEPEGSKSSEVDRDSG
jgi:hypothetical protein